MANCKSEETVTYMVISVFGYAQLVIFVVCIGVVFLWYKSYKKSKLVIVMWVLIALQLLAVVARNPFYSKAIKA